MKTILLTVCCAWTILLSCSEKKDKQTRELAKADWILGDWINKTPYGNLTESWQKTNDSLYNGQSFFIKGKDTMHNEKIELKEINGVVTYNPTVQGQNGNKAVEFKLKSATDKLLVFENPAHDYPQKIMYSKITNDSIVATISGKQQGKPAMETFPMSRVKTDAK